MGDRGFTKSDMDRMGIFKEMEYITTGDPYKRPDHTFNAVAGKGKQMLPGGSKDRSALQGGYFAEKYGRVFEGEGYSDPIKMRRQHRIAESKKNLGKTFLPSSGDKTMSGPGNHFGTFSGPVSHFEPNPRPAKAGKKPGRNFTTNPPKKGTGFGYLRVTLGDYPKYQSETYDRNRELNRKENESHKQSMKGGAFRLNMHPRSYFDQNPFGTEKPLPAPKKTSSAKPIPAPFKPSSPAKRAGGSHAGTFDPYPTHSTDPYVMRYPRSKNVTNKYGKTFYPSQGPKTTPQTSVINQNVVRSINRQNYRTIRSVTAV